MNLKITGRAIKLALMEPILMLRLNFVEYVHLNAKAALTIKNARLVESV